MKQIKSILLLRIKQGYRYLNEIGFLLILLAIFILTGIIFRGIGVILTAPALASIALSFFILFIAEVKRTDTNFLKSIFKSNQQLIRYKFIENLLIISPILIFQGCMLKWKILIAIIAMCGLTTLLPFHIIKSQQSESKSSINFIPLSLFEIKFFFEKKRFQIAFLFLLLILGSFHISFWILGIVFFCVLPIEIFTPLEPTEMLNYQQGFVRKKLVINIIFFLMIISGPTLLAFLILKINPLIFLYGIVALILSVTLAICKKYVSYYGVNQAVPTTNSTVILTFIMLAPGGILITLAACIYYYIKSENHLKKIYAIL